MMDNAEPRKIRYAKNLLSRQTDKQKRTIVKVYLDDERATPEGWTRVYWPEEAIELLRTGMVEVISLDHDLGDDDRGTGYDVVKWIAEQVVTAGFEGIPRSRVGSGWSLAHASGWDGPSLTRRVGMKHVDRLSV